MTNSEIDDAVFAVSEASWIGMTTIIVKAADSLGTNLPEGNKGHRLVARRIEALVSEGRLVARGDIKKWRNGEVCQALGPSASRR